MKIKTAINGFGRIGRNVARVIAGRDDIELVAINDLSNVATLAHLLKYDSVHGKFNGEINTNENRLVINGKEVRVSAEREPKNLKWQDIDVALECTGFFTDGETAKAHLEGGSKKVLISAPAKNVSKTIVYGVNDKTLTKEDVIVSNASCTTNCLAPVAKVLHESIGIEKGYMTTIHAYTGDQPTLDRVHSDMYRARSAALSMIPTSTGAAQAVGLVLPELQGKLSGSAIRVPTPNVSCIDLKFIAKTNTSIDEINALIKKAASGELKGILGYEPAPLVSADMNGTKQSSIFAPAQTQVVEGNLARVLSWYDNEWGFSNRMCDTAVALGRLVG